MTEGFKLKIKRRTLLILAAMIAATELFVFRSYIFGKDFLVFYDIGSDTAQQYIPLYTSIVNKLRAGDTSLWDSKNVFGNNMFLYNLTNPALDAVYLIGVLAGPEIIPYLMLPMYLIEIMTAGLLCCLFLSAFSFDEAAKGIASYMYAFNGFMIVWGQHYQFAIVCTLLPLELLMTERFIRDRRKWKALVITTFVVVMNSMYMAYMILIFSGFYVLVRFLMRPLHGLLRYIGDVLRTALVMLLGVFCGCISLIPSVAAIALVSNRLASGAGLRARLFGFKFDLLYYATLAVRMLSSSFFGITEYIGYLNYYEGPCLFFTSLFLILGVQYVFLIPRTKRSKKAKIIQYLVLAAAVYSVMTPTVGVVFNGFTVRFCRWMFLCFIYFALISAETLTYIFREKKMFYPGLLLSALFIVGVGIWANRSNNVHHTYVFYASLILGLAMCAVLVMYCRFSGKKPAAHGNPRTGRALIAGLAALVLVNAAVDTYSDFEGRWAVTEDGNHVSGLRSSDTAEALAYIRKNDTEIYRIEKSFAVLEGTDSLVQDYRAVSGYNSTQNANILKYIENYWGSLWYHDTNHSRYVIGIDNGSYGNQGAFCGIRYVLSETPALPVTGYTLWKQFGSIYVFKYDEGCGLVALYPESGAHLTEEDGAEELTVDYASHLSYDGIKTHEAGRDGLMQGTVSCDGDAWMVTTIPYETGWSVLVDGKEAAPVRTNKGFIGVKLPAGSHEITWKYTCPGFREGALVSIIAFAVFAAAVVAEQVKKRRGK